MKYRLGDICTITKGETGIMKAIDGAYTMVTLGETNKTHNAYQFDTKAVIIPLVSSTGHGHASMKRVKYQEGKFALGSILCAVIPKDENFVLAKYLHIYLHWNREELLVSQMKGMANVSLPMNKIADVIVTVPSLEKQKEIVELEKKLVEKELEADKLYTHQLTLIENLNQAILQEAVQGKLVPQDPTDEPASQLLERIKAEKAKTGKKEKPLPPIKPEEIPFEIPENWVWCRLGDLGDFKRGPFGSALTKAIFVKDGYKVYEQRNAIYDNHTLGDYFVTEEKYQELKTFRVRPKDLIVSCSGATLGRIAEIPEDAKDGIINQALMRIRLHNSTILNSFFIKLFRSPNFQKNILSQSWGTAIPNMVGLVEIKKIPIPLPPLSEQQRIVAEIEKQLGKTKELKAHIIANQQATEQLLKALLHGAFEVEGKEEKRIHIHN